MPKTGKRCRPYEGLVECYSQSVLDVIASSHLHDANFKHEVPEAKGKPASEARKRSPA